VERCAKRTRSGPECRLDLPPHLTPGGPPYLNLLYDEELDAIRPYLEIFIAQVEEVLENTQKLYATHFGDKRSFSSPAFREVYFKAISEGAAALLNEGIASYAVTVWHFGERLADRGVPFSELVAIQHFINQSALPILMREPNVFSLANLAVFEKLNQVRAIILAEAYFRGKVATFNTRLRELEREAARLETGTRTRFHGLVGSSPTMRDLYEMITAASNSNIVLVCGESGTGKELVARAIHEAGHSSRSPFIAINCAAIPKELIESELFGYKKGAFSGATEDHLGVFQAAQGGTVFLDEVTEMSADAQSKLLRAVQEWAVRPVGSPREVPVNVRLVASTNRDPEQAAHDGYVRQDLYYRLQACVINVPPLRERLSDLTLLVEHFIDLFNHKLPRPVPVSGIEPAALEAMRNYRWPGNVRELSNAVQRGFIFGRHELIRLQDLPTAVLHREVAKDPEVPSSQITSQVATLPDMERDVIARTLELVGGNKSRAAEMLGISRKSLYTRLARLGLAQ
jgi:transcriptional regulator with PAS, ATPase and Fis domain